MPSQHEFALMLLLAATAATLAVYRPLQLDWRELTAEAIAGEISAALPCIKGDLRACTVAE